MSFVGQSPSTGISLDAGVCAVSLRIADNSVQAPGINHSIGLVISCRTTCSSCNQLECSVRVHVDFITYTRDVTDQLAA